MASFDVASSSNTSIESMLDAIADDVKMQKNITFDGDVYQFDEIMLVDGKLYDGNVETLVCDVGYVTYTLSKTLKMISLDLMN